MSFFLNATATWTYAMYLTVQTSLHWISDNTITNVKIVRFNESNSPCLIFTFFDLGNGRYLNLVIGRYFLGTLRPQSHLLVVHVSWHQNEKQGTRGHNTVADGWAGACNSHPDPRPSHIHSHRQSQLQHKNARFRTFQLHHHGPTDQQTDGQSLL